MKTQKTIFCAKAYVVALIFAMLLITSIHAVPNYDVNISKMTLIGTQVAHSTAACVATASNTDVESSTFSIGVSGTGTTFSGQGQFQMLNGTYLYESFAGSCDPEGSISWELNGNYVNPIDPPLTIGVSTVGHVDPTGVYNEAFDWEGLAHIVIIAGIHFLPVTAPVIIALDCTALMFWTTPLDLNPKIYNYNSGFQLSYPYPDSTDLLLSGYSRYGAGYDPIVSGSLDLSSGTLNGSGAGGIPEPATVCLLSLGGLALLKKRRA